MSVLGGHREELVLGGHREELALGGHREELAQGLLGELVLGEHK